MVTNYAQQASSASLSSSEEELRPPSPAAVPPEWENAQQLQRDGTTYRTVIRSVNRARSLALLQKRDCLQLGGPAVAAEQTEWLLGVVSKAPRAAKPTRFRKASLRGTGVVVCT